MWRLTSQVVFVYNLVNVRLICSTNLSGLVKLVDMCTADPESLTSNVFSVEIPPDDEGAVTSSVIVNRGHLTWFQQIATNS